MKLYALRGYMLLLILVLNITLLAGTVSAANRYPIKSSQTAVNGVLDLTQNDMNQTYPLDGEWRWYPNELLVPGQLENKPIMTTKVPGNWNLAPADAGRIEPYGSGTYQLDILLPEHSSGQMWAIHVPTIYSAYTFWVNGRLVEQNGVTGDTQTEQPGRPTKVISFASDSDRIQLMFQVTNHIYRSGGITSSIHFGKSESVYRFSNMRISTELFLTGGLIMMSVYHLGLYVLRRKDRTPLYFGMYCLTLGIRGLFTGERAIYDFNAGLNWAFALRFEYILLCISVIALALFVKSVFPKEIHWVGAGTIIALTSFYIALCLMASPEVVSRYLLYFQYMMLIAVLYALYVFFMAIKRKREGAIISGIGITCFVMTVINDILSSQGFIETEFYATHGLYVFIICQSFILAISFSRALTSSEELTQKLLVMNSSLEEIVQERTQELKESNQALLVQSLLDGLTGIANRRCFNDNAHEMLQGKEGLCLLLMDIDHFKKYNDTYGHFKGDECLRKVAKALQAEAFKAGGIAARYGGEEFAVIAPADQVIPKQFAEQLVGCIKKLQLPHSASETEAVVTISCGVAVRKASDDPVSIDTVIQIADQALYTAKALGRNRYYIASVEER
ncbi:diguanylate cyclase domain-containing protein [Paenibacillus hexagrammi]|uniref:Diguanylate cyclase n=1 Tax=Paenibacillus hexagrammi TaxID=2908839 RepID=A0ABY3SN90_9BACL|nr:diguanylate cyclase [Paenibacillus sp. YPD9-1]UJF34905.1 diguanylate cyclase [Paenibacillus sp. YPD9-1]